MAGSGAEEMGLSREKLRAWRQAGINRLSIGLQSADDRELGALGRIHTWRDFRDTYQAAVETGFSNINVDLMSAIPFQTEESWEKTLRAVAGLTPPPAHISAYSLIIEEGTPFYERYGGGRHAEELPDEDAERRMYERTEEILSEYGLPPLRDLQLRPGPGTSAGTIWATGTAGSILASGTALPPSLKENAGRPGGAGDPYQKGCHGGIYVPGTAEDGGGIPPPFPEEFQTEMEEIYGTVIEELCRQGLLETVGDRLRLTRKGIDVSNYVMSEFLLDGE